MSKSQQIVGTTSFLLSDAENSNVFLKTALSTEGKEAATQIGP